eukprot:3536588-Pyramimonas_sp.AAC.1
MQPGLRTPRRYRDWATTATGIGRRRRRKRGEEEARPKKCFRSREDEPTRPEGGTYCTEEGPVGSNKCERRSP